MPKQGFHIINAAAGSGKTYTLVLHYLEQLLATPQKDSYQSLLAMTFTNKAVNEMKERILKVLSLLAKGENHDMKKTLLGRLQLSEEELQWRAENKLRSLLHHYSAFEVTTLDSFTHSVIRTFAFDLGLSQSFELIIDSQPFIHDLVEQLVNKVGLSPSLTSLLTEFSLSKIGDEKSWDVTHDLNAFAPILMRENDRVPLQSLRSIDSNGFQSDRKRLEVHALALKQDIQVSAQAWLDKLENLGLSKGVFSRETLPNHFRRLADFSERSSTKIRKWYDSKLEQQLEAGSGFFKKDIDAQKKALIGEITPELIAAFQSTKNLTYQYLFSRALLTQWVPLSLLGTLERSLQEQQLTQNRMLLGRFNERIAALVKNQPVPFIYERLGTRFQHYFIDEFQDTSLLQWQNLIPLISHALENFEGGSLLLVGDPKQAIYRWRGGDVQQYVDLLQEKSPFQRKPQIDSLKKNYRSYSNLIAFNNTFFAFAGQYLKNTFHQNLFGESLQQQINDKSGGTVAIHRIEAKKTVAERAELYADKIVALAQDFRKEGYQWKDITILIRQKKQAQALVKALQEAAIPALSSDSLLLGSSEKIQWVIQLLHLSAFPEDKSAMLGVLSYIRTHRQSEMAYHDFMLTYLNTDIYQFFKDLNRDFDWQYDLDISKGLNVYETMVYLFACFSDLLTVDAYTQRLFDVIFEFSDQYSSHTLDFLKYWEREVEHLTIPLPTLTDAVQIMTVHKSKGLEFPIVIYPFLEDRFAPSSKDYVWYPLGSSPVEDVPWARLSFSAAIATYGDVGQKLYQKKQTNAALDAMNLLYVGFTRAIGQLHLITPEQNKPSKEPTYATILNDFVLKQGGSSNAESYFWSQEKSTVPKANDTTPTQWVENSSSLQWRVRLLPERKLQHLARDFGILIHDLLSKIRSADQLDWVIALAVQAGQITEEKASEVRQILIEVIDHPALKAAFDETQTVWIEQDILLPDGKSLRPDRVVVQNNQVTVIDFKTGQAQEKDCIQILEYGKVIKSMGYSIQNYHLVYIGKPLTIESF